MASLIASSAVRTCFGTGAATFAALLDGACGTTALRRGDLAGLNVAAGHHVRTDESNQPFLAGELLAECVRDAVRSAGLTASRRVSVLVGTGLGELSAVEQWALTGAAVPMERLHFGGVLREALPGSVDAITLWGACSAGGHALALAQDLLELGDADAVVVGATDVMTLSLLAMIGKVAPEPTDRLRPFDRDRTGVLLGEGAAALVLVPDHWTGPAVGRLLATGLSCDARHATAPDVDGIRRSMRDAFDRAGRDPAAVDLVVAHGTGTALNDPVESTALRDVVLAAGGDPLVTAAKGAIGHTSGSAALINVDLALRSMAGGVVPPIVGLSHVLDEGAGLRFVRGAPVYTQPRLAQVNAFGFGGVNAVSLVEAL